MEATKAGIAAQRQPLVTRAFDGAPVIKFRQVGQGEVANKVAVVEGQRGLEHTQAGTGLGELGDKGASIDHDCGG